MVTQPLNATAVSEPALHFMYGQHANAIVLFVHAQYIRLDLAATNWPPRPSLTHRHAIITHACVDVAACGLLVRNTNCECVCDDLCVRRTECINFDSFDLFSWLEVRYAYVRFAAFGLFAVEFVHFPYEEPSKFRCGRPCMQSIMLQTEFTMEIRLEVQYSILENCP